MWWLAACSGEAAGTSGSIDASALWPAEEGRLYTLRLGAAGAEPADDTGTLDALLLAYVEGGGCPAGDGWRLALREGDTWAEAEPRGALHFDAADGLALCGWEDESGASGSLDPALPFWTGTTAAEGEGAAGSWSVRVSQHPDLATYYGVFPSATDFALSGPGEGPSGWALALVPDLGLAVLRTPAYTADLVHVR